MFNLEITVCHPENDKLCESQVYTNRKALPLTAILDIFSYSKTVSPEIGNFPHVGGNNKPVKILTIYPTSSEDNAGVDINEIIEKYLNSGG